MAQALRGSAATPFSSLPPGLEADLATADNTNPLSNAADEVRARALDSVEEKISQLGPNASRQAIVEAIREAVLQDVDSKVAEKVDELWQRGKQMLGTMQQKHKEKTSKLTEEVAMCHERTRALESENERLKQVLQGLATRFSLLGQVFTGKGVAGSADAGAGGAGGEASAVASTAEPSELFSPGPFTPTGEAFSNLSPGTALASAEASGGGADGAGPTTKLPDVPAFPFPAQSPTPAAPLSLAEALGTLTPQRTPLSLVNSLTPTMSPEAASPFPAARGVGVGGMFSFTLRKADGADLGLNVSHNEHDQVLRVEAMRPDGAIEAWNRQCQGSAAAEKAVMVGDKIISVNHIMYDPQKMLEECRDKQLLKLTIVRGDRPLPTMPAKASPPVKSNALRADASVFVPMSADSSRAQEPAADQAEPGEDAEGAPPVVPDQSPAADRAAAAV